MEGWVAARGCTLYHFFSTKQILLQNVLMHLLQMKDQMKKQILLNLGLSGIISFDNADSGIAEGAGAHAPGTTLGGCAEIDLI